MSFFAVSRVNKEESPFVYLFKLNQTGVTKQLIQIIWGYSMGFSIQILRYYDLAVWFWLQLEANIS